MPPPAQSLAGEALTELFVATFQFHGALVAAGDKFSAVVGLTTARWQVLGALSRAGRPETVSNIARFMGLARQSVQRTADELAKLGLVAYETNPHHKRAPLVRLTEKGQAAFRQISDMRAPWVNALAAELDAEEIAVTTRLLKALRQKFDEGIQ
ncbi:MAG TPA: MarR family transcriptional regulator [Methylocystis sp.]|nr:MarR family transcriptional regulator [Methylocystis sp.]